MEKVDRLTLYELRMVKERDVDYEVVGHKISTPEVIVNILDEAFEMGSLAEEVMILVCMDTKNQIISMFKVSQGSLNASIVHPREIFKRAVLSNANSIMLAHNHPSGDPTPSKEDLDITARLKDAGDLMGIRVLDHIIIADTNYISFKEKKLI